MLKVASPPVRLGPFSTTYYLRMSILKEDPRMGMSESHFCMLKADKLPRYFTIVYILRLYLRIVAAHPLSKNHSRIPRSPHMAIMDCVLRHEKNNFHCLRWLL
jgi:hypothetical protein